MTTSAASAHLDELRDLIAEVLEIEPEEITETGSFVDDYEADSLRAIEILARIEKKYKVEIPQEELAKMENLLAVYETVKTRVGWSD
ncbi:acyl carrier protein [Kitasatospora sp. MAP12-15]|uniref:acyl carrier protein n=1 Tax=unclassified Kitasatospora TaxID=2633591 RepID=UPI0024751B8D|nr:acyl carrier protein [Kitasatospora sp. MAP12-44]MDH6108617.1 acyl carrier protein [Kitasatospora sp. MAP12-44]